LETAPELAQFLNQFPIRPHAVFEFAQGELDGVNKIGQCRFAGFVYRPTQRVDPKPCAELTDGAVAGKIRFQVSTKRGE